MPDYLPLIAGDNNPALTGTAISRASLMPYRLQNRPPPSLYLSNLTPRLTDLTGRREVLLEASAAAGAGARASRAELSHEWPNQ